MRDDKTVWYHSRETILCKPFELPELVTYKNLFGLLIMDKELFKPQTPYDPVVEAFNKPDFVTMFNGNAQETPNINSTYGLCNMRFIQGVLVNHLLVRIQGDEKKAPTNGGKFSSEQS
jgi:hypothetical protein